MIVTTAIKVGGQVASAKLKKPPVNVQLPPGDTGPREAVEDPYMELLKATQLGGMSGLGRNRDLLDRYGVVPWNPGGASFLKRPWQLSTTC